VGENVAECTRRTTWTENSKYNHVHNLPIKTLEMIGQSTQHQLCFPMAVPRMFFFPSRLTRRPRFLVTAMKKSS
jgi:hypothetical protein